MYDKSNLDTDLINFSNFVIEKGIKPTTLAANLMSQAFSIYSTNMSSKEYKELMKDMFKHSEIYKNRILH